MKHTYETIPAGTTPHKDSIFKLLDNGQVREWSPCYRYIGEKTEGAVGLPAFEWARAIEPNEDNHRYIRLIVVYKVLTYERYSMLTYEGDDVEVPADLIERMALANPDYPVKDNLTGERFETAREFLKKRGLPVETQ